MTAEIVPFPQSKKEKPWKKVAPGLWLHVESGVYYVRKFKKGKGELFKSTGETKLGRAKTKADEIIQEWLGRTPGLKNKRITISELCDLVLEDLRKQTETRDENGFLLRRPSTFVSKDLPYLRGRETRVEKRRKGMREQGVIRDLFGDRFADELDEQWWAGWLAHEGRAVQMRKTEIAKYLSLVLSFAHHKKYIAQKPELVLPESARRHKKHAVIYSDEQVLMFFNRANPTLQDLIIVGSENPLRPHENFEVAWSMVKIHRDTKGKPLQDNAGAPIIDYVLPEEFVKKNARTIRLTPNAARVILRRWLVNQALPERQRSPYVFPAPSDSQKPVNRVRVNRWWHTMKNAAGIDPSVKVHFHWFRHNVYRRLLKIHGIPMASVSQVGGTSIQTLQKHYDLEEEQAQLQVAAAISLPFVKIREEEKPKNHS